MNFRHKNQRLQISYATNIRETTDTQSPNVGKRRLRLCKVIEVVFLQILCYISSPFQ